MFLQHSSWVLGVNFVWLHKFSSFCHPGLQTRFRSTHGCCHSTGKGTMKKLPDMEHLHLQNINGCEECSAQRESESAITPSGNV